jgi:hypothetical protein
MKVVFVWLVSLLAARAPAPSPFGADLLKNPIWDDGKAEYSVYDAQEVREGLLRPAREVLLVVKEPFNMRLRVKSDQAGGPEVLKMNRILDVPTGVYAYHQMYSAFWGRASGELFKFSLSSSDTCGNTFKLGWLSAGFLKMTYHTYWDGEGDGQLRRALPEHFLFYDDLPFHLRFLGLEEGATLHVQLFPSIIESKVGKPEFTPATIRLLPSQDGSIRVELARAAGKDEFLFDSQFPHVLKSWTRANGSSLKLKKTQRLDYWHHNKPGDEKLLE